MAIKIEWQSLPQREKGRESEYLYPRLTENGTIGLEEICRQAASKGSAYNRAHLKGAFTILADAIAGYLAEGKNVVLDDMGTLQLTIGTLHPITSTVSQPEHLIQPTGVRFTPSEDFMKRIGSPQYKTISRHAASHAPTMEEMAEQTLAYLNEHTFITRAEFEKLFHLKRSTANIRISELIQAGILKAEGENRHRIYRAGRHNKRLDD